MVGPPHLMVGDYGMVTMALGQPRMRLNHGLLLRGYPPNSHNIDGT